MMGVRRNAREKIERDKKNMKYWKTELNIKSESTQNRVTLS